MKFIIGLTGSGKTTTYRTLNENKILNAVEIELPQSCLKDEKLKVSLFNLYYKNPNIDCIISHPYYLPKDFWDRISEKDEVYYLDIPLKHRLRRIKKRSKKLKVKENIFPKEFIKQEEEDFIKFKRDNVMRIYGIEE